MIGHDLTLPRFHAYPGRALLQYYSTFGLLEGNHLVVLQKNRAPEQYTIEHDHIKQAENSDTDLVTKALSYSLWASKTVDNQLYHLPNVDLTRSHP